MARRTLNNLTTNSIQKFVRENGSTGKTIAKADGGGLTLTISKSSYRVWILRYRHNGKLREYTLTADAMADDYSLKDARTERDELKERVRDGEDIALTKQLGDSSGLSTFTSLADEWYFRNIKPNVQNQQIVRRVLDKDILPKIGPIAPADLEPHQIDDVLQSVVDRGAPTIANDALRYIQRILTYARERRVVAYNVAADFDRSDAGGKEKPRSRNLKRDELIKLFKEMRNTPTLGRENELAFKVLPATCVRKSELVKARWSEFDLDSGVWHLSPERTKTELGIEIPLAPPVVEWLEELKVFAAGSECLLPKRRIAKKPTKPHISPDTLNVALKRVNHGLDYFTIHDLRRTVRSLQQTREEKPKLSLAFP